MVLQIKRVFVSFLAFGLIKNILYVVILSAAVDIVGFSLPKAIVLLADIVPSLSVKLLAPFFIHKVPYITRIWILVVFSSFGMLLVSMSRENSTLAKLLGVSMASLSSGLGEVSFLQLTHFYDEKESIGGFSMGTGAAGILGSLSFLIMTNLAGISTRMALLVFAIIPFGFPMTYHIVLPKPQTGRNYEPLCINSTLSTIHNQETYIEDQRPPVKRLKTKAARMGNHLKNTIFSIKPLIKPYMIPLCSVYIFEYVINQGISPTLLFPLSDLPKWLITSYRDIYVVYGFVYQLGVFLSRSSLTFGFRFERLYTLSVLQMLNLLILLLQSICDFPFDNIVPVVLVVFYEGLLGGLLYVNTFLNVSQNVHPDMREFSMACVGISDSFGIMIAGFISLWLEKSLCTQQVSQGKDWCELGS
ncbi:hypothetical protein METBIDRAFT_32536 [Metschnikowia bicuspidata var. bicuspidata NRRL YB-4993]|uniref:Protein BTN n=1 Tax=Metschnikowia bicuspidata var. bicuspidata NRRL YB-4993 TaxID=869754 RepID=A0A1A0H8V1_9ASCO|nr:hypothetical protein METBIDRAFT_32536 [Metschnikowia bicuspidata var. bicuspidata NRRL YB-4993]OBA20549.1 hypothetical protein METBIDRAFT_32536 [Metschnikowia bicuspidata var. bicuspidata NRRL YB-4993]